MNKIDIKAFVATFIVGLGVCLSPLAALEHTQDCAKELLTSYFPEPFVVETLTQYNVSRDRWDGIMQGLAEKDKEIIRIVEEKASRMSPNPLKDNQQRQLAVKLFRETLTDAFDEVMKKNGITDETQTQAMLNDIQQRKAKYFTQCMEKQRANMQGQPGQMQPGQMHQGQAHPGQHPQIPAGQ